MTLKSTPAINAQDVTGSVPVNQGRRDAADVESDSGVRVVRQGGASAPGALIIEIPHKIGIELNLAPDRRLVEKSKYGPLPRIGADGSRPFDIYARPLVTPMSIKPGAPRIALVVGGMGLSETATRNALEKLPGDVTFAFAPYGPNLDQQAAKARAEGHELLLQLPMESFEGAATAGDRTLESSLSPDQIVDRMHWHLARFSGYVGVENFLGQRFTSRETAIAAVMGEVARRGLLYLDDGSSPVSLAPSIGASLGAIVGRADLVVDADRSDDAIAAAFAKLEAIAREKGAAIGTLSALPGSVERAAQFVQGLEKRGVALVPLSAIVGKEALPTAKLNR